MSANLTGKTILLIAPAFFGYSSEIERTLRGWGARVFNYENRPLESIWGKALVRLAPRLSSPVSDRYFLEMFDRHRGEHIDYLFVIRGEALSPKVMEAFRLAFPAAKRILYLWDSFKNDPLAPMRIGYFDIASSFDPDDASRDKRLRFVPLFYLQQFADLRGRQIEYDLSFVGTVHSDRYKILRTMRSIYGDDHRLFYFLYLQSPAMYWVRRFLSPSFWSSRRGEFSFSPLGRDEVLRIFGGSRAVVDIERSVQSGLTMRSLETLGAQRKLVTTNASVCRYDFYDERNIAVIDRHRPRLPEGFLDTPFAPTKADILAKYSVEQWLLVVLGLRDCPGYLRSKIGAPDSAKPGSKRRSRRVQAP